VAAAVVVKGGWLARGVIGRTTVGRYHARLIAPSDTIRLRGEFYESRRAPVEWGVRASKERPLEILFRSRGEPPPPEATDRAEGQRKT
jgi:hypothetical protein